MKKTSAPPILTASTPHDHANKQTKVKKEPTPEYAQAQQRLSAFLQERHKNRTPERENVLQMLYRLDEPVDIGTLHQLIEEEYGIISLQSVYNTLQTLTDLGLARKLMLQNDGTAFFEKTLGVAPHAYAVCQRCGQLLLLPADALPIVQPLLPARYHIADVCLLVQGKCWRCQVAEGKEERLRQVAERKRLADKAKAREKGIARREKMKKKAKAEAEKKRMAEMHKILKEKLK